MKKTINNVWILSCALFLASCTAETHHHGVPDATWKQLSAAQKQMIIDQHYQQVMAGEEVK